MHKYTYLYKYNIVILGLDQFSTYVFIDVHNVHAWIFSWLCCSRKDACLTFVDKCITPLATLSSFILKRCYEISSFLASIQTNSSPVIFFLSYSVDTWSFFFILSQTGGAWLMFTALFEKLVNEYVHAVNLKRERVIT